jgi:hypothetical protein
VIAGTEALGHKWMAVGVALHVAAYLGREILVVQYGVGIAAALALAYGCSTYLRGKGYPWPLGLPGAALSIVWVGVCLLVPDREQPPLPAAQLPPRSGD